MTEIIRLPKFENSLSVFSGDLRSWVFSSQAETGRYFGLTHATISRYENGHITPQLGYLACLAQLITNRLTEEAHPVENHQKAILQEVNKAIRRCYPEERPFRDWDELGGIAKNHIAKRLKEKGFAGIAWINMAWNH